LAHFHYVVVGGGMTADAACRGIRDRDPERTIGLFAAEQHPPYARPPLSKALWAGKEEASIWRGTEDLGVSIHLGRPIAFLDPTAHRVAEADGTAHTYERLLLATGGSPRRLAGADGVVHYRTLDDFRRLRPLAAPGTRIVVVGGGFIGSEIAAALVSNGADVTMLFPEAGIGARLFPAALSSYVNDYYREKGVEVLPGELVAGVDARDSGFTVRTESGSSLDADAVVAGLGIVPDTALAEAAGLPVDDGVLVDEQGRVQGHEDVFAAGDVARFPVPALGGTRRVEHEDHANTHGRLVGANMAGEALVYDHLPFFYSDLFDLGYEAVGDVDARLTTVESWAEPSRKGVVGYVDDDGRARGFLLWDTWGKVDAARDLVRTGARLDEAAVRSLLD
jgi:3-phenylpropionate/trans-cinnamate dioxygenase ferredoxin reductase component